MGFALPFMILGLWPRALSFLPRPGPWMLRLKQFLAFPMYGAAAWLAWVLAQEAGANGVAVLLAAFVALALAAWLWGVTRDLEARGRGIGAAAAAADSDRGAVWAVAAVGHERAGARRPRSAARNSRAEKLASLRASGKPVFVDATAAWCITCLVNEQAVLSRPAVKDAFNQKHVTYMVADWTNRNAAITKLLDSQWPFRRAALSLLRARRRQAGDPAADTDRSRRAGRDQRLLSICAAFLRVAVMDFFLRLLHFRRSPVAASLSRATGAPIM